MPIREDVNKVISTLSKNDQIVKLTRQYKGITLAQEARVIEVTPDTATLQATRHQNFPLVDGDIHIHSQALSKPVAARIRHINLEKGMYLISDLAYADWKNRQTERVQPQKPIYINIFLRKNSFRALLEDISLDGVGVLANKNIDPAFRLKVGSKLKLNFQIDADHVFNNLSGMLVYRQKVGLQLVKFGIHLYPEEIHKAALQEIISQRRAEILNELDQAYSQAYEPQRVENLYF